jgi:bacterioferritin-associated ferredoxin
MIMAFSIMSARGSRMYVCCCNAVTDREVAEAIDQGAVTRTEVTRACGAGGDCGACHGAIEEILAAHGCGLAMSGAKTSPPPELVPAAALVRGRAA